MSRNNVIVLDRDGVINRDSPNYIRTAEEFLPIAGSMRAIAILSGAGFRVVVASNQSGVGRGLFNNAALRSIHEKLIGCVEQAGGNLTAIYVCPHHPDAGCLCRKPKGGLLKRLASDLELDTAALTVIGDSQRDLTAAETVGARPVLVRTGNGVSTESELGERSMGVAVFDDLLAAATWLVSGGGEG